MAEITDEELITRGMLASELLGSSMFQKVMKSLVEQHTSLMIHTTSVERDKREFHHQQITALLAIEAEINSYVSIGQQIKLQKDGTPDEADYQWNHPFDDDD